MITLRTKQSLRYRHGPRGFEGLFCRRRGAAPEKIDTAGTGFEMTQDDAIHERRERRVPEPDQVCERILLDAERGRSVRFSLDTVQLCGNRQDGTIGPVVNAAALQ
jgi:hypothetical protein